AGIALRDEIPAVRKQSEAPRMMKSGCDRLHPHPNMIGVDDLVILRQHRIGLAYQDQRKRDGMCGTDPTTHWAPRDGRRKKSAIGNSPLRQSVPELCDERRLARSAIDGFPNAP